MNYYTAFTLFTRVIEKKCRDPSSRVTTNMLCLWRIERFSHVQDELERNYLHFIIISTCSFVYPNIYTTLIIARLRLRSLITTAIVSESLIQITAARLVSRKPEAATTQHPHDKPHYRRASTTKHYPPSNTLFKTITTLLSRLCPAHSTSARTNTLIDRRPRSIQSPVRHRGMAS